MSLYFKTDVEEVTGICKPASVRCYRHEADSPVERAWIAWAPGRKHRTEYVTLSRCGCTLTSEDYIADRKRHAAF